MIKIDNTLLQEVGLGGLPDPEKNSFLKHIYETLEMNVGVRLADQMTNEQLDEFEQYFEAKDDAGAFKWLESNFPNYKDIVQQEFDKLKAEVAQSAPQILAASQAQAAQNPAPAAAPSAQTAAPASLDPQPQYSQQPAGDQSQPQPAAIQQPAYQSQVPPQAYAAPAQTPLNDPYQPGQPAIGSTPAPTLEPASAPVSPYPQAQPQQAPPQPYAAPVKNNPAPQQQQAPAPDPQQPYQSPFPQQQPPAGPQFPPQQ